VLKIADQALEREKKLFFVQLEKFFSVVQVLEHIGKQQKAFF
jgi:hypothetical protein